MGEDDSVFGLRGMEGGLDLIDMGHGNVFDEEKGWGWWMDEVFSGASNSLNHCIIPHHFY
jgi:hypothetical protein